MADGSNLGPPRQRRPGWVGRRLCCRRPSGCVSICHTAACCRDLRKRRPCLEKVAYGIRALDVTCCFLTLRLCSVGFWKVLVEPDFSVCR